MKHQNSEYEFLQSQTIHQPFSTSLIKLGLQVDGSGRKDINTLLLTRTLRDPLFCLSYGMLSYNCIA